MNSLSERDRRIAGFFLFVGIIQFFMFMLLAEIIYPGYSVHGNYISDLGVGQTAYIFNSSIVVFGIMIIVGSLLVRKMSMPFSIVLALAGVGAMGVGLFPETTGNAHLIASLIVFLMSSIAPYFMLLKMRRPISIAWSVLGTIGLIALILYIPGIYLGLGNGGMERMIAYPNLLWGLTFGSWLIGTSDK